MAVEQRDPPLLVDAGAQGLQQLASVTRWSLIGRQAALETAQRVFKQRPPPKQALEGLEAAEYLQAIEPLTRADILEQHSAYGSVRWLWYLRRAPDTLFEGEYGTTLGYDKALAEILSSELTAADPTGAVDRVAFRVDEASFRHLVRYVARVKLISQLHMLYRRVGKGATLDARHPLLMATTPKAVQSALAVYDRRHDLTNQFIGSGLGLLSVDPNFEKLVERGSNDGPIAFLSMACRPFRAPVSHPDGAGGVSRVTVQARHALKELNVARILSPLGADAGLPSYLPDIAGLTQLLMLIPTICLRLPWALSSVTQFGYVFVRESQLRELVNEVLPEIVELLSPHSRGFDWASSYDPWIDAVHRAEAHSWPIVSGHVLRRLGDSILIDTSSSSQGLLHRLELLRSPLIGNLRARAFELQCQDIIDSGSWRPPGEVRALRGRPLRVEGRTLTDIDALASKGKTILLISCKSIVYYREYDQGAFRVVRNIQSTVDSAVTAWDVVVAEIRRQPAGENFDLSAFDEIVGIVCTPFAAYSIEPTTLAFVRPNLRAMSSILELRDWLAEN